MARAVDELRRGAPVRIDALTVLAVELADDETLAALEADGRAGLILAHPRAALLNIVNQRAAAASHAVWLDRAPWMDLAASVAVADPVRDLATPFKGPFASRDPGPLATAGNAAVRLAKLAGLLPAVFAVAVPPRHSGEGRNPVDPQTPGSEPLAQLGSGLRRNDDALLHVAATAILAYAPAATLRLVTRARLPLEGAENTQIVAFRAADGGPEHLALLIGDPALSGSVLTRLHSACLTGDLLGSLKCDCGPQLRGAIAAIASAGGGILLYLQQEGRGIGLINKLRAYALQDQGFDTVDANLRLGFDADERDFALAAAMLRLLGVARVRLLTNNPDKVAGLEAGGIAVVERVAHTMPANPHNARYLDTKRARQGHLL